MTPMTTRHSIAYWQHSHDFQATANDGERRTLWVLILTAITMLAEIVAGSVYGSMALLADGWHMGTHVAAFMITLFAYRYARRHADNPAFSFGTGKVNVLGGFASAVALAVVALVMLVESLVRLFEPQAIQFDQAIFVAVIGLTINLISAYLLKDHHHHHHHGHGHDHDDHDHRAHEHHEHHDHDHDHDHDHEHDHHKHGHDDHGHDLNLRAAYMHVLADALTSILAIAALLAGKFAGLNWLDPVMGMVGALIIARWAVGLVQETSPILLDASIHEPQRNAIRQAIEADADNQVSDIHVWRVSSSQYAAMISLVTHTPKHTAHYKHLLHDFRQLAHVTIEINECRAADCPARDH
ncbi:cation diffusion facilitator family transporter [Thalassolituus sp. LLYu03]|uniref:cation diffusion facilitator family transporter n=1 Tax=Thalassolituus sp. LLYu03 TaxID=3421656 RepID=UPI003D2D67DD